MKNNYFHHIVFYIFFTLGTIGNLFSQEQPWGNLLLKDNTYLELKLNVKSSSIYFNKILDQYSYEGDINYMLIKDDESNLQDPFKALEYATLTMILK